MKKLFEGMDEDTRKALQKRNGAYGSEYREDVGGKELDEYNINDYRNIFSRGWEPDSEPDLQE